jgi:NodT family efflux transporter outer membrane factor (OMF) lipoprotein
MRLTRKMKHRTSILLPVLLFWACVGPRYHTRIEEYISFERAYDSLRLELPEPFWIERQELHELIALAYERNPDILTAAARVKQARAAVITAQSSLFPSLQASGAASRSKTETIAQTSAFPQQQPGDQPGIGQPGDVPGGGQQPAFETEADYVNRFQSSLAASYEIDLWTRLWRRRKAAVFDAIAVNADARAISISLVAQLVDLWLNLTAQRRTLDLLESQLDIAIRFADLTEYRYGQGLTAAVDVAQQKQQAEEIRGRIALVRGRIATFTHRIAVLTGRLPGGALDLSARSLPPPPGLAVAGVPADLFRHRPDVEAAYLRLKAADSRAAAAVLDFFPSIQLSANLFSSAEAIANLFDEWFWTISGTLSQPLFTGGRLIAGVKQATATAEARYYEYMQTALTALREVRDALMLIRSQEEYVASLNKQVETAENVLAISRERYAQGASPYIQVLTAFQSFRRAQVSLVDARRQLLAYHVQLYRAVGGDFKARIETKESAGG